MEPRIEQFKSKKLIGKSIRLSLTNDKTTELWKSFMMNRKLIKNPVDSNLYAVRVYADNYFSNFNPTSLFEKWATTEVIDFNDIPEGMETLVLQDGLYAVFVYRGAASAGEPMFQYIYGTWLPNSNYMLDNRPHFEILGEKYKNGSPDSEEEIWIPIKLKI